ncbi:hypothetical protein CDIK_0276 [Cucumispora dikerogammari]|nr:hypothetical protein CDIK_0276 [Cucumispora dikerogammari]
MLRIISFLSSYINCFPKNSPIISTTTSLICDRSRKTKLLPCKAKNSSWFIKTSVVFKDVSYLKRYNILKKTNYKNFKVLFTNTIETEDHKTAFVSKTCFSEIAPDYLNQISMKCYKLKKTNMFSIELNLKNCLYENNIIEYMRTHPTQVYKLCFILLGPVDESINSLSEIIINQTESKTKSLLKLLKDIEKWTIRAISEATEWSCRSRSMVELTSSIELCSVFDREIQSTQEFAGLPVKLKIDIIDYIKISSKLGYLTLLCSGFFNSHSYSWGEKIELLKTKGALYKEKNKAYVNIKSQIIGVFKSTVKAEVENSNLSIYHRNVLLEILSNELDNYSTEDPLFLYNITNSMKRRTREAAKFLFLETDVYKLNIETLTLETVLEAKEFSLGQKTALERKTILNSVSGRESVTNNTYIENTSGLENIKCLSDNKTDPFYQCKGFFDTLGNNRFRVFTDDVEN